LDSYRYLVGGAGAPRRPVKRVMQRVRSGRGGGVGGGEDDRLACLREADPLAVVARLESLTNQVAM
jgi:hypothetical protein